MNYYRRTSTLTTTNTDHLNEWTTFLQEVIPSSELKQMQFNYDEYSCPDSGQRIYELVISSLLPEDMVDGEVILSRVEEFYNRGLGSLKVTLDIVKHLREDLKDT